MAKDNLFDALSASGAERLKRTIRDFWKARGFRDVLVERYEIDGLPGNWGVRSNLVNGRPA
jgi:hypothetical protein